MRYCLDLGTRSLQLELLIKVTFISILLHLFNLDEASTSLNKSLNYSFICRVKGASSSGKWDLADVDFTDQNIYIFFGTLPRLLKAFAHSGVNAADETGDTVLHRYLS